MDFVEEQSAVKLLFDGSAWCNVDMALRNLDTVFRECLRPRELSVIEWYILRALYECDGQHASELARAVGRAATSFTPNLDKLQSKGYIERRPDLHDRRAVRIFLTPLGQRQRQAVLESARRIDDSICEQFGSSDYEVFQQVLMRLQQLQASDMECVNQLGD